MSCSREEIERKRLAALQKRQSKTNNSPSPLKPYNETPKSSVLLPSPSTSYSKRNNAGPTKSFSTNSAKPFHPYAKPENNTRNVTTVPVDKVISGTIYLISEERFEVKPSEFCTPLIDIFKTLPSRNYDAKTKLWNFAVDDYQLLMSKVAPLAPYIVLGALPNYVLKVLKEPTMDPNNVDLSPIEATLRNKLMPFQQEGVRFGIAKRGRCMIADDMGLGKTFQALAIASYYRHNWPLLIVTTSSMRETWQSKVHELLPSTPLLSTVTVSNNRDAQLVSDRQTEVVICSYKMTTMLGAVLREKKFGVIIVDESHFLKSHKAQCTVALSSIARAASQVVLLSGTPALSRPAELHTQLELIEKGFFGSYTDYGKRYCAGKLSNFGWDMSGQSNLTELQVVLQRRFLIRRTKDQVLTTLELKTRESVFLDQSLLQFSQEEQLGLSQLAAAYRQTKSSDRHSALMSFFSESARAKIPAICKYIKQVLHSEDSAKFLIFAHHKIMIDAICYTLDELGTHYICIVGSTPTAARADLVDKFQHIESCRCAVLSITAANSGITLTAASLVLFAELHWNPGIITQAEARAHRIGQRGGVRVRYLLAAGTCDDHMWPMLQGKLDVLNEVGLSKDSLENTTESHQESRTNITQYLNALPKNRDDYIPGTNIRKGTHKCDNLNNNHRNLNNSLSNENVSLNNASVNNNTIVSHNSAIVSHNNTNVSNNSGFVSHNNTNVSNNSAIVSHNNTNDSNNSGFVSHNNTNVSLNSAIVSHNDVRSSHIPEDVFTNDRKTVNDSLMTDEFDRSFLEDDEGDQLLAELDL